MRGRFGTAVIGATASVCVTAALALLPSAAAAAAPGHDKVVSDVPAATPAVNDGAVFAIAQVANTMVIGGTFTSATSRGAGTALSRSYLAAFDATSGTISTTFVPTLNGAVQTIQPGPGGNTVYVGGNFTTVNGANASHVALLNIQTGAAVPGFRAAATNGAVSELGVVGNRLFVGGSFGTAGAAAHAGLATLNASTGAVDPFMNLQMSGHHNDTGSGAQAPVGVKAMDTSPDGKHLVVVGNFRTVSGSQRDQIVLVDISGAAARVQPDWSTNRYDPYCYNGAFDSYMRGVAFSPDGTYFVVASSGGGVPGTLCDAASRFEMSATGTDIQPTWVDSTGGDTLWSVAVTEQAVYVGGHQRWLNNSFASDYAGPGAIPRPGLAALDTRTGLPLGWDPGRNPRGAAAFVIFPTSTGLWVGSDTEYIGNRQYKRPRLAFFPLAGGKALASDAPEQVPGSVFIGGPNVLDNGRTLFRVNAGGGTIASQDSGPDWAADDQTGSSLRNSGSNTAGWGQVGRLDATVPAGVPSGIFSSERWDPNDNSDMQWAFPVAAGTPIEIRLFFANQCSCTNSPDARRFDVSVDSSPVLQSYDIVGDVGDETATMKSFDLTSDGTVNIDFAHVAENPLVNGIEIVRTDVAQQTGSVQDALKVATFDGATTAGSTSVVDNGGINWSTSRGAFVLGGQLYTGSSDGNLYRRAFDGTAFGAAVKLAPWDDPKWAGVTTGGSTTTYDGRPSGLASELSSVKGMFYLKGLLYYTLSGDSHLYDRFFSPDSGIVGADRYTASSGYDFSRVAAMFYSGGEIFVADRLTGDLSSIAYNDGSPAATARFVDGPSAGGNDWRGHAIFVQAATPDQPPTASFTASCTRLDCSFDGSASADADGTIASYSWDFGDGTHGSSATASHSYPSGATRAVTLTVTDDRGGVDTATKPVTSTQPNAAPTAAFTSSCGTAGSCAFDGSGSADAHGSIGSYAWDFGDEAHGATASPSHSYDSSGTYPVSLTVTDNDGTTDTVSHDVTVTVPLRGAISFVGRASTQGNVSSASVKIPTAAQAGDTGLLFASYGVAGPVLTPPPGWTQLDTRTTPGMTSVVWQRTLTAADPGATVTVKSSAIAKVNVSVVVYSGTSASGPTAAVASNADVSATQHTTPRVTSSASTWVVSYWADKSNTTSAWTAPNGLALRGTTYGVGTGRVTSLLADSGANTPAGPAGGLTAGTNAASGRAINVTIVLTRS